MQRLGTACTTKLFLIWGAYSIAVTAVTELVASARLPESLAWGMAGMLAVWALVETER